MIALLALVLGLAPAAQESERHLKAGQEKLKVGDFDGAIPDFEKCLGLDPAQYNACFGLGVCFWEKEEFRKSREQFARVVELVEKEKPGAPLPGVRQKLLACALLLEDFDAAIVEADRLIRIQETAEYYYARALARARKGDGKGALEDCAAALKEDPRLTKARSLKADVLFAQGDDASALAELAEAARLKPSDPAAFLARACAHYRLERWNDAREDLRLSLKLNQGQNSNLEQEGYARALAWFADARGGVSDPPKVAAFAKALKELGRSPEKNHFLALPLYLAGEVSEPGLLAAAEAAPARKAQARAEVLFFVAEAKLLRGDRAGAREGFRRCVDTGARGVFEHDLAVRRLKSLGD